MAYLLLQLQHHAGEHLHHRGLEERREALGRWTV
jgi:hypothetical protein